MSTIEFTEEQIVAPVADRTHVDHAVPFDPERLARAIATAHGATWAEVRGRSRVAHLVEARRQIYLALREREWSLPAIAKFVGGRNHTTVMAALRKGTPEGDEALLTKKAKHAMRDAAKGAA